MENNVKKRMYKKGKFWVVATVTTLALGSALSVQADDSSAAADADTSQAVSNTVTSITETSQSDDAAPTTAQEVTVSDTAVNAENSAQTSAVSNAETPADTAASFVTDEEANAASDQAVAERLKATASDQAAGAAVQLDQPAPETNSARTADTTESIDKYGLTDQARQIATQAGLDLSTLTYAQVQALNKVKLTSEAQTGYQMTYKDFEEIADTLIAQDGRYAIPYFNAQAIKNMKAATTRDAQTGEIADLDVWDSWPVQDVKTGQVVNWNGYQLVVAMMGIPNTNDNHIYLLYNKYGDNNFDHWKNAGPIFGFNADGVTQQWSGSATLNDDGSIQLYYTKVDTSDNNSNNQRLATATLYLGYDAENVKILSVENDKLLTPGGGDGYYYQSYSQWRSTFTGADNIAMRDPHVIEDDNGDRYLVFEASTGLQNYQGEDQIYHFSNYGGDTAYKVKSLFRFLENDDMYSRASWSNAAIGILKLKGDHKTPEVDQFYTPLLSSPMVSDEIERPNVVKLGDKYYLFAASRLNHGSNTDAWNKTNQIVGDNVIMLGYVSDSLTGGYLPLNGNGAVLTASVPADWRTATYSYYAVPVEGSSDTLLITAYMTNRNEVAGKGNNSTWAPSFLIQVFPDGTTKVLAEMTQQGDWIWDETSRTTATMGTLDTAYLPGENDGYIDWNTIGGYGLKPHAPSQYQPKAPSPSEETETLEVTFNISIDGKLTIKHSRGEEPSPSERTVSGTIRQSNQSDQKTKARTEKTDTTSKKEKASKKKASTHVASALKALFAGILSFLASLFTFKS